MKDAVAYMAWERVVPWKILSMTARPGKPLVPLGFGARNRDFNELLGRGSRIWVVTRISNEFSLAREFRKSGMSPWLDALSIPGYKARAKARGDRIVNEPRLEKLIKLGIEEIKFAVVIRTKTYLMALDFYFAIGD